MRANEYVDDVAAMLIHDYGTPLAREVVGAAADGSLTLLREIATYHFICSIHPQMLGTIVVR